MPSTAQDFADRLMRPSRSAWVLMVVAVAVFIRAAWALALVNREPRFDEVEYLAHAARVCDGAGYVNALRLPDNFWPVGYPALLAARSCGMGHLHLTGVVLQVAIGAATSVLVFIRTALRAGDTAARRQVRQRSAIVAVLAALMLSSLWLKHLESIRF